MCENNPAPSLLIIGCSKRKRQDDGLLSAINRYDGPLFRVLRKFSRVRSRHRRHIDIYVLSAEFGLIPADQPIPNYDRKMTAKRSLELAPIVQRELVKLIQVKSYQELYLGVGQTYLHCLFGDEYDPRKAMKVTVAEGAIGRRTSHLKKWLYEDNDLESQGPSSLPSQILQDRTAGIEPAGRYDRN